MLTRTIRRATEALPRAHRFAIGSAWFFAIFSLLSLGWVVVMKATDPSGLTTLYQTAVASGDGLEVHRAFGLAYDGVPGLLLALMQAGVVGLALASSVWGRGKWRWAGHGVLVMWAALWMLDLMYLAGIDQQLDSIAQATLMSFLTAATVVRALTPRRRTPLPAAEGREETIMADTPALPAAPPLDKPAPADRRAKLIARGRVALQSVRDRGRAAISRLRATSPERV